MIELGDVVSSTTIAIEVAELARNDLTSYLKIPHKIEARNEIEALVVKLADELEGEMDPIPVRDLMVKIASKLSEE